MTTIRTTAGENLAEHFRVSALREIARHAAFAAGLMRECAERVGEDYGSEKMAHEDDAAAFEALAKALEPFTAETVAVMANDQY